MKHFGIEIYHEIGDEATLTIYLEKLMVYCSLNGDDLETSNQTDIIKKISHQVYHYCFNNEISDFTYSVSNKWFRIEPNEKHNYSSEQRLVYDQEVLKRVDNVFCEGSKKHWMESLKNGKSKELDLNLISWAIDIALQKIRNRLSECPTYKAVLDDTGKVEELLYRLGAQKEIVERIK